MKTSFGVVIAGRVDALIWRCVDAYFSGSDPRSAIAELELQLYRRQADFWLSPEWVLDVLRETDPSRVREAVA